jgi:hypothetical protein
MNIQGKKVCYWRVRWSL